MNEHSVESLEGMAYVLHRVLEGQGICQLGKFKEKNSSQNDNTIDRSERDAHIYANSNSMENSCSLSRESGGGMKIGEISHERRGEKNSHEIVNRHRSNIIVDFDCNAPNALNCLYKNNSNEANTNTYVDSGTKQKCRTVQSKEECSLCGFAVDGRSLNWYERKIKLLQPFATYAQVYSAVNFEKGQ